MSEENAAPPVSASGRQGSSETEELAKIDGEPTSIVIPSLQARAAEAMTEGGTPPVKSDDCSLQCTKYLPESRHGMFGKR